MEVGVAVAAALLALFVVLAVIVAVRAGRAVKLGVERTVADTRRTVEETSLRARRAVQPGPVGEIAALRLGLRESIDSTRRELEAAVPGDPGLRESLDLLNRLHDFGRQLDGELRQLEREPDKGRIADRLPEARRRAQRIRNSADSLRFAAQDRRRHSAGDDLEALSAQIEVEAGALRHWAPADEGQSQAQAQGKPDVPDAREGEAQEELTAAKSGSLSQDAFQALLNKIEKVRRPESPA